MSPYKDDFDIVGKAIVDDNAKEDHLGGHVLACLSCHLLVYGVDEFGGGAC